MHLAGSVYFTSETMLREHPDIVQSFVKGVIAGWQLAYAETDRAVPLIARFAEGQPDRGPCPLRARQGETVRSIAARFLRI
jgi:ABC-type nitrate/sulfonate/bicarbonate transport system substrate-binding protein